jgi:hypothetical protein
MSEAVPGGAADGDGGGGGGNFGPDASRFRCFRFADVFGLGRVVVVAVGTGLRGASSTTGASSGAGSSAASSSATGMMNPKSTSPTLCLLIPGQIVCNQIQRGQPTYPAPRMRSRMRSCPVSC